MEIVSVVIPVYNVEKYIENSTECLMQQTYSNLEIILVDDGSKDNSGKICDNIAKNDSRIKVIHKQNGGVSSARNEGLKLVTGKYLYFMDSDDWIEKDFIEKMVMKIEQYKLDICICNFSENYANHNKIFSKNNNEVEFNSIEGIKEILKQDGSNLFLGHLWNKLFLTEKVKDLLFNENSSIYEDLEYVYKAFKISNKIMYIPYVGYHYVQRNMSAMYSEFSSKTFSSIAVAKYIFEDVLKFKDEELNNMAISFFIRTNLKQASMCSYSNGNIKYLNEIQENIKEVNHLINDKQYYTIKDKIFIKLIILNTKLFNVFYTFIIKPKKKKILQEERKNFL